MNNSSGSAREFERKRDAAFKKMQRQLIDKGFVEWIDLIEETGKGAIKLTDDGKVFAACIRVLFGDACDHPERIEAFEIIAAVHLLLICKTDSDGGHLKKS